MTFNTNRNYIKPMFRGIAQVVMILLCLLGTIRALQGISTRQFTDSNSVIYSSFSFLAFGTSNTETFNCFAMSSFSFLALMIAFIGCFAFLSFLIFYLMRYLARLTIMLKSIFLTSVFVKFRNLFILLTFRTSFRYDFSSHNQLLISWLRLEPVAAYDCGRLALL